VSASIRRRRGVDDDIADLAQYLLEQSEPAAFRFVDAVQRTLNELAAVPGVGSPKSFHDPRLANVRSWWIKGFPNHLVFYQPIENGIMVLAVIHGSRDIERLLIPRA
jgi:plasmid stabilization system protein ParE